MSEEKDPSVLELLPNSQADPSVQSADDGSCVQAAVDRNDDALRLLGNPGRYSILVYMIGFCLNIFVAFNHVSLPSLYAVPIPHRCLDQSREVGMQNISAMEPNMSLSLVSKDDEHCFQTIAENNSNWKRVSCKKWSYTYPHGYTETWVNEWDLVCNKTYILSLGQSMYMAGVMIGSPLTGIASDHFGRRAILLCCLLLSSVLSLLVLFVRNVFGAISVRFIIGFFISGVQSIVYLLPAEILPRKLLPVLSVATMNSFIVGIFIGNTIIYFVKEWKTSQLVLCSPGIVLFIIAFFVQPESPRWALARQKEKKYRGFFKASMDFNKVGKEKCEKIFEIMDQSKDRFKVPATKRKIYTAIDLFKTSQLRKRSFIGMYVWFTCGISFYALSYNIPNLSSNPFLALLVGSATDLPCFLLAFFYIPRLGKRRSLIAAQLIGGLACLLYKLIPHLAMLLVGKMFLALSFGAAFIYLPEIFPTIIRNVGVGTLSFFSRAGGLLAPQLVLIGVYTDVYIPVIVTGCLAIIGGIVTITAPETKGKELPNFIEDIEHGEQTT